jgi:hypothetical protein
VGDGAELAEAKRLAKGHHLNQSDGPFVLSVRRTQMVGDDDSTTRRADLIPVAGQQPAEDAAAGDQRWQVIPVIVETDDHEEAGYGYGV